MVSGYLDRFYSEENHQFEMTAAWMLIKISLMPFLSVLNVMLQKHRSTTFIPMMSTINTLEYLNISQVKARESNKE